MTRPTKATGDRRAARLAAVQALYQLDMADGELEQVIAEFAAHRLPPGPGRAAPDLVLFADLVRGGVGQREALDALLAAKLTKDWSLDRLPTTLRAVLRAAAHEILNHGEIPPQVTISEYVAIARGFFDDQEIGFINGMLDRLARELRGAEMAAARPERA